MDKGVVAWLFFVYAVVSTVVLSVSSFRVVACILALIPKLVMGE